MDEDLGVNDPYRSMDSGSDEIRPDFVKNKSAASGALSAAENAASFAVNIKGASANTGAIKTSVANVAGDTATNAAGGSLNGMKAAMPFLIVLIALVAIVGLIIGLPVILIGAIDYNLQKVLGFTNTIGILEEVGEHVTSEYLANGNVPSEYASSLADAGVLVGQLTSAGDFVRTNSYIANIDERNDLVAAASGFAYISEENGELALLYDGEVIKANDFVARVEADPTLYAAYSKAADLSAKYYYGTDVEKVYQEMGLSRGNFNEWTATGNNVEDEKSYYEILNQILDNGSGLTVGGYHNDKEKAPNPHNADLDYLEDDDYFDIEDFMDSGTFTKEVSGGDADEITGDVADKTRDYVVEWGVTDKVIAGVTIHNFPDPIYSENATERAAELLNTAVSSGEPYLAANAFMAIEEPIQRARVGDNGPVNQVMNTLTRGVSASYQNVQNGSVETTNRSILETANFRAAVSDSEYSKEEAENFGRDRVLKTTGQADSGKMKEVIQGTTITSNGKNDSSSVVRNGRSKNVADEDAISKAKENIELSQAKNNSESFQSIVGGNRIIEGGSFLSNTINMKVIGAMPSDASKIAEYNLEVEKTMARKTEAERVSKSPFDITSPNTFLGNIVHNIAAISLKNYNGGLSAFQIATATGDMTNVALSNLKDTAVAVSTDKEYTTMSGNGCETVSTVSVEGDLYCTSHNTPSTKYINYTLDDWKASAIGGDLESDGSIKEDSGMEMFVTMGMDRSSTVGVKNAEVCQKYRDYTDNPLQSLLNSFKDMAGIYDVCDLDADGLAIATGAKYTFGPNGDANSELYSGYALYDEVRSLLSGDQSEVSLLREKYYSLHPEDDSAAGIIARRSGLTKTEAEIALVYADYLNMVANYDAKDRYLFGEIAFDADGDVLTWQNNRLSLGLLAWRLREAEYEDLRNRNYVV